MKYLQSLRTKNPESQCIQGQNFRQAMALAEDWRKNYACAQKSALDNF